MKPIHRLRIIAPPLQGFKPIRMYLKQLPSILLLMLSMPGSYGQSDGDTLNYARSTLYASGLGNGLYYSVSWDYRWRIGQYRWMSLSGGLTYRPGGDYPTNFLKVSVPMQWNWFRGRMHHREHGAGLTFGSGWYTGESLDGDAVASQGMYLFIKPIGYRYQRPNGGFFFRFNLLAWIRIIELNRRYLEANGFWETPPVFPWMGLDLGYTFKPRKK